MEDHLRALGTGPLHLFTTWEREAGVPEVAVGVYTIWRRADVGAVAAGAGLEQLVYVGYGGRSPVVEAATKGEARSRRKVLGLRDRLRRHTRGQRSGNQFALYVADRLVLPTLSQDEITAVTEGRVFMDALVRRYIASHLGFRWVETLDAKAARAIEAEIRHGRWTHGKPLLNPLE